MARLIKLISLILTLVIAGNCYLPINSTISSTKASTPNIIASLSIVADFTSQLSKGLFSVNSIVTGSENPHLYEPTPSEIEAVVNADLFIRFGLQDLEPWVDAILLANPFVPVLTLVTPSMMRYDPLIEANNPHVWLDPTIVKEMVDKIYYELITIDPINNSTYLLNRNNYQNELDDLLILINTTKIDFQGLKVIEHHPAFMYLLDLLEVERIGVIEEHEGEEPSAEHINMILEKIITENVTIIINQPQLNERQIAEIARKTGIQIADLTPLLGVPDEDGFVLAQGRILDNYIKMIEYNLVALKNPHDPPTIGDIVTFWILVGFGVTGFIGTLVIVSVVRMKQKGEDH